MMEKKGKGDDQDPDEQQGELAVRVVPVVVVWVLTGWVQRLGVCGGRQHLNPLSSRAHAVGTSRPPCLAVPRPGATQKQKERNASGIIFFA